MLSHVGAPGDGAPNVEIDGRHLFDAYEEAWRRLGNGLKVKAELELQPGEHFELAAWGLPGAIRVAAARARQERRA